MVETAHNIIIWIVLEASKSKTCIFIDYSIFKQMYTTKCLLYILIQKAIYNLHISFEIGLVARKSSFIFI